MTVTLTQEAAVARVEANGFEWLDGPYLGHTLKYQLRCTTCGEVTHKSFKEVGKSGCKKCSYTAKGASYRLTHDEAVARGLASDHPAQLLEPYKGRKVKHLYRFVECGHEQGITPHNLNDHGHGCGSCWFDLGPTYVYVLSNKQYEASKIGVTAVEHSKPTDSRIHQLGREGWILVDKFRCDTRDEALAIEKEIVDSWKDRGFPPGVTKDQIKGGYGETIAWRIQPPEIIVEAVKVLSLFGVSRLHYPWRKN